MKRNATNRLAGICAITMLLVACGAPAEVPEAEVEDIIASPSSASAPDERCTDWSAWQYTGLSCEFNTSRCGSSRPRNVVFHYRRHRTCNGHKEYQNGTQLGACGCDIARTPEPVTEVDADPEINVLPTSVEEVVPSGSGALDQKGLVGKNTDTERSYCVCDRSCWAQGYQATYSNGHRLWCGCFL
jgi:hypothetical protein